MPLATPRQVIRASRSGLHWLRFRYGIDGVSKGASTLADNPSGTLLDVLLLASGSEVHLAPASQAQLARDTIGALDVSMPSKEYFALQSDEYRSSILPSDIPMLAIEAGVSLGWRSYVGPQIDVVAVETSVRMHIGSCIK